MTAYVIFNAVVARYGATAFNLVPKEVTGDLCIFIRNSRVSSQAEKINSTLARLKNAYLKGAKKVNST